MFYKIIFTLIVIIGFVFLMRRSRTPKPEPLPQHNPNIPNAFRTKTSALNMQEQQVLLLLQQLVSGSRLQVFPKPQLATFISIDPRLAPEIQQQLSAELKQITCDFMLVDQHSFSAVAAITFDPPAGLQKVLKDLNVDLIALSSTQTYDAEKLRTLLVHYL
ncbi:DUF2726 domain-containing protein [Wohlfahrtiimonas chitiniclastica]|uniref:DUF2726 domain-containing protein n=1 Tax=Wohlfahrtiimonas chitiniclastica TaxID=400946 RepID=UPI001BCB3E75|nr:DUF2726 domain-containing protein [Wohlfahrtiimonas chitiniclastica]MBS7821196.1 DUF2726 domain-containing protein [Wohlfahrtiimonas chitiniclastica]MBS7837265.1 DUF2726 domain-containing protein [Wohlfahrtiimonas chitiniclastica]